MPEPGTINGIILRVRPLTESSLIVCWLTAENGRISTVARGAHRPKSPFRGKLDLFYSAAFSFRRSRRSELHNLAEVSLLDTHPMLRREIAALQKASYAAQLIELATETDTPLPEIYSLFESFLNCVSASPQDAKPVLAFEMKLLNELGFSPEASLPMLRPSVKAFLADLGQVDWDDLGGLSASPEDLKPAERFLRSFIAQHLGRVPKGREAALEQLAK
jgi:DNA repair protein RecO (recombination protein O)